MQASLNNYKTVYYIKSRSSDRVYEVTEDRGIFWCPCRDFQVRGSKYNCWHIVQAQNQKLRKEIDYLKHREERARHSQFESVDEVVETMTYVVDMEFAALIRTTLELAKANGQVSTEDVREAVQDKFLHNPSILGSVVHSLKSKGLIVEIGRVPKRNKKGHRKTVGLYKLSEEGEEYV